MHSFAPESAYVFTGQFWVHWPPERKYPLEQTEHELELEHESQLLGQDLTQRPSERVKPLLQLEHPDVPPHDPAAQPVGQPNRNLESSKEFRSSLPSQSL